MENRKCPNCGHNRFSAHQVCRLDVIVGPDGEFEENLHERADLSIYDSEKPYGPFRCMKCGAEFDELKDMDRPYKKKRKLYDLQDKDEGYICASILVKNDTDHTEAVILNTVAVLKQTETRETFYPSLIRELKRHGFDAEEVDAKTLQI